MAASPPEEGRGSTDAESQSLATAVPGCLLQPLTVLSPQLRRRTYVFAQNPEDYELYSRLFSDIHTIPVRQGNRWKPGYSETAFDSLYPLEKKICFLRDDVAGGNEVDMTGGNRWRRRVDLSVFIPYAFQKMKESGTQTIRASLASLALLPSLDTSTVLPELRMRESRGCSATGIGCWS